MISQDPPAVAGRPGCEGPSRATVCRVTARSAAATPWPTSTSSALSTLAFRQDSAMNSHDARSDAFSEADSTNSSVMRCPIPRWVPYLGHPTRPHHCWDTAWRRHNRPMLRPAVARRLCRASSGSPNRIPAPNAPDNCFETPKPGSLASLAVHLLRSARKSVYNRRDRPSPSAVDLPHCAASSAVQGVPRRRPMSSTPLLPVSSIKLDHHRLAAFINRQDTPARPSHEAQRDRGP